MNLIESSIGGFTELVSGDASIHMTLAEFSSTRLIDLNYALNDFVSYLWNPYLSGGPVFSSDDSSALNDPSTLFVGPPLSHPFKGLKDIAWKLSTSNPNGVISTKHVSSPLFIYDNDIRFYDIADSSSSFIFNDNLVTLFLERAKLRDPNNDDWIASEVYSIYPDPSSDFYLMEDASGKIFFDGYVTFTGDSSSSLTYAYDENYKVPLLKMKNFSFIDSSGILRRNSDEYTLDIIDGKIGMSDPSQNVTEYINFSYDASINEQSITHDVIYLTERVPLYEIDPSAYYWTNGSGSSFLLVDNSVCSRSVNKAGDYFVEAYGYDNYNNTYYNKSQLKHRVWVKRPTLYSIVDGSTSYSTQDGQEVSPTDISSYVSTNARPIYDKLVPYQGISLLYDGERPYINIPSITYFQDVMDPNSINKFYNLTERVTNVSGNTVIVDRDFQFFKTGDSVALVKLDRLNHQYIDDASALIQSSFGSSYELNSVPSTFVPDSSYGIYIINTTERTISNPENNYDASTCTLLIGSDPSIFLNNQLLTVIASDSSTYYSWGASYRIIDSSDNKYTLDGLLPIQFLNDPARYSFRAKHAFTAYSETELTTNEAYEDQGFFKLYLNDPYKEMWFIDSTFVLINIPFDHDEVESGWVKPEVFSGHKRYSSPLDINAGSVVILISQFDSSGYLRNQKNIWTVRKSTDKSLVMRVYNDALMYKFSNRGYYDVQIESYDSYGNVTSSNYEGIINII